MGVHWCAGDNLLPFYWHRLRLWPASNVPTVDSTFASTDVVDSFIKIITCTMANIFGYMCKHINSRRIHTKFGIDCVRKKWTNLKYQKRRFKWDLIVNNFFVVLGFIQGARGGQRDLEGDFYNLQKVYTKWARGNSWWSIKAARVVTFQLINIGLLPYFSFACDLL